MASKEVFGDDFSAPKVTSPTNGAFIAITPDLVEKLYSEYLGPKYNNNGNNTYPTENAFGIMPCRDTFSDRNLSKQDFLQMVKSGIVKNYRNTLEKIATSDSNSTGTSGPKYHISSKWEEIVEQGKRELSIKGGSVPIGNWVYNESPDLHKTNYKK